MQRITGAAQTAPPESDDQPPKPGTTALRLLPGTGPRQIDLPISFDSKRGCDRIRARLYADQRLKGLVLTVLLALSEFVDVRRKAWPRQTTLAKLVHASRENVGRALSAAAEYAVLTKDRHRRGAGCQYTFLESWIAWFRTPGEGSNGTPPASFRSDDTSHLEVTIRHFSGEPVQGNLYSDPIAAAGTSRANSADRRQQQQLERNQVRIEGLFAAIASRARQLGHDFDEASERRRLAAREIDIAALQALADDLDAELAVRGDVRHHRITSGLAGGGRCAVCGRRAPSETELCPGRPRRSRIQALAEDCADAAAATGTAARAG